MDAMAEREIRERYIRHRVAGYGPAFDEVFLLELLDSERAETERLRAARYELIEVCNVAARWFQEYERGHREKGDTEKAERNEQRALAIFAVIERARERQGGGG